MSEQATALGNWQPNKTIAISADVHDRLREVRDRMTSERVQRFGNVSREATFSDAVTLLLDTWAEVTG